MNKETRLILENQKIIMKTLRWSDALDVSAFYEEALSKKIEETEQALSPQTNDLSKQRAEEIKEKGCGKYFQHGVGEFICGGGLHVNGKKKLCPKCSQSEVKG